MGDDEGSSSAAQGGGMTLRECQYFIQKSFKNPTVKFLMENLEKSGCGIGENFIKAANCTQQCSGGFVRGSGIVVCYNHLQFQDEVEQTLIHELIHAYDDCRAANLEWENPAHQACSEIRANHLSGNCHYRYELLRGYVKMKGQEPECVKRRAMQSVAANHSTDASKSAIEAVWDTCYNDTAPFDRAP